MIKLLKFIFYISLLFLIILSVFPGSLLGFLFHGNVNSEPSLVENPFGSTINHFIYYLYISLLGLFLYLKNRSFNKMFFILFFLSVMLEMLHFILPYRAFELGDLFANILGVIVAYCAVKTYLLIRRI